MSIPSITWRQALAWRLRRHLIDPIGSESVEAVVARLCGVQAQVASSAELAIRLRQGTSASGEVTAALAEGRVIKTWAMRGTLHLLRPPDGLAFLSLIAAARPWTRTAWVKYFGATPEVIEAIREAARNALKGKVLTREELIAAIVQQPGLAHVNVVLESGWGTLLKPIAWQGDLCFGPPRGNRVTFMHPSDTGRSWAALPSPEDAAQTAIEAYFGAHGPATPKAFSMWLASGYFPQKPLRALIGDLEHRLAEVDVEGQRSLVPRELLDDLLATEPTSAVRLHAGFDQWVLGPGTDDAHVIPTGRRRDVSRQSGWIAPVVTVGGVVAGTWTLERSTVSVDWWPESGRPPRRPLAGEVDRLSGILGRDLELSFEAPGGSRAAPLRA